MATPTEVRKACWAYRLDQTPENFEALKKLVSETTFTRNELQVYGEDPYYAPDAYTTVVTGLTYEEDQELRKLAKFTE